MSDDIRVAKMNTALTAYAERLDDENKGALSQEIYDILDAVLPLARLGAAVEERCAYSLDVLAHDGNIGLIAKQQIGEDVLNMLTSTSPNKAHGDRNDAG